MLKCSNFIEMDCFWCNKDCSSNVKALKKLCSSECSKLSDEMKKDLTDCYDCVLAYHNAKDTFLRKYEKAEQELLAWEVDRLSSHLNTVLYPESNDYMDTDNMDYLFQGYKLDAYFGFGDGVELQTKLSIPLQEILNFPYLLWNKGLAKLAVKGLLSLEEAGSPLIIDEKLPGIYLLLIHPKDKVRKWARKSVNFLGSVSCDNYDDLSLVVNWIMRVYEFGLFQSPNIGDDIQTQSSYTILPSHLFVQNPVKEFWLGVCMLLKALEVNTVRLQLVSRDHHPEFVGVVVTALDHANAVNKKTAEGSDSEFWPILHCFIILLERLGMRIWQHVTLPDAMNGVFTLIVNHPAYRDELVRWPGIQDVQIPKSSPSDELEDGTASSSQMVYNWDGRKRKTSEPPRASGSVGKAGKRKTVVFALFKPYMKSVMDFGDVGNLVVKKIVKYLHYLREKFEMSSLGYDSIMSALLGCLDHLQKTNMQSLLPIAADLWIMDVIEILSSESLKQCHCRKVAIAFCKSLLERLAKTGVNVTSLLTSFQSNPASLDALTRLQLKELLEKHFQGNRKSPSSLPRFFERERRMILQSTKKSRRDTDTTDEDRSSSDKRASQTPVKQQWKFVMLPKCSTSEVSGEIEKLITKNKKPCASVKPIQLKQSTKWKGKSIIDYCDRTPLLDARIPVRKLNVRKKSDGEGTSSDVLVVDDSDDFMSDESKKEENDGVEFRSPKLSLKIKRKNKYISKKVPSCSVSPSTSSTSLITKMPSDNFHGEGSASKIMERSSEAKDNVQDFITDSDDDEDLLKYVDLIDAKVELERSSVKRAKKNSSCEQVPSDNSFEQSFERLHGTTSRNEKKMMAVKVPLIKIEKNQGFPGKVEKDPDCVIISDDSSEEDNDVTVTKETRRDASAKKGEGSDESWDIINDDINWKVKDEPIGDAELIVPLIKTEMSRLGSESEIKIEVDDPDTDDNKINIKDLIGDTELIVALVKTEIPNTVSNLDSKSEIKIEVEDTDDEDNQTNIKENEIKQENLSPTWSLADHTPDFCFNGDVNPWDFSDGEDDLNDPLDTMTCVETDLSELHEDDEVILISDGDEKGDVINDDVINDDVSDDVTDDDDVSKTNSRMTKTRSNALELDSSDDESVADAKEGMLTTENDDARSDNEATEKRRGEPMSADVVPTVSRVDIVVSDSSSPEHVKRTCFSAMISKLKSVTKRGNYLGTSPRDVATRAEHDVIGTIIGDVPKSVTTKPDDGGKVVECEEDRQVSDRDKTRDEEVDKVESENKSGTLKEIAVDEDQAKDTSDATYKDSAQVAPVVAFPKQILGKKRVSFHMPPARAATVSNLSTAKMARPVKPSRIIETKPRCCLTVDDFYRKVLSWDANLLFKTPITSPTINHGGRVPRSFTSMDNYYNVFKPLVLLEVWAQLLREWGDRKQHIVVVDSVSYYQAYFQLIQCKKRFRAGTNVCESFLQENSLVVIERKGSVDGKRVFAFVERVSRERGWWKPGDEQLGGINDGGQYFEFTITLRMLATAHRPVVRETLHCVIATSLVTYIRQWEALMFLPRSLLARDVLTPRIDYCGTRDLNKDALQNSTKNPAFNDCQHEVIERTSEALRKPFPIPRICFIQGPPGTGKSHTIIGLIKKYFKNRLQEVQSERENQLPGSSLTDAFNQYSGRILLCAPSNAAVDVLVRRLIGHLRDEQGALGPSKGKNCGTVNLIRIGRFNSVHPQVHPFTLDVLCKTEIAKLSAGDTKEQAVKTDLDGIRAKIDQLEKKSYVLQCAGPATQDKVKELTLEIDELLKKKRKTETNYGALRASSRCRKQQESKIKKDVLLSADIICCTLSGSGSQWLHGILMKNKRRCPPFGCIIVDEACQSSEVDVLIPLQFGCSKLVLVGDPEQLRTTILSQEARQLQFCQSLYERHYRVFRERAKTMGLKLHMTKDNPIQMLDVQYRMHPDIALFPSNHVYFGRLKNSKNVLNRQSVCDVKPYVVLNVLNGKELLSQNGSLCNLVECNLVVEICMLLRKALQEKHFGIVTPYRAQVNLLERHLRERGMEKIEVNTVDGFQGREKEIIIMSCVRASNQAKGIGFLADRQRMNVALTRARHSLIILLNVSSLVTNKDWKACIDDACNRGVLHDVHSSKDLKVAFQSRPILGVATTMGPSNARDKTTTQGNLSMAGVEGGCKKDGCKITEVAKSGEEGETAVDILRNNLNIQWKISHGKNEHKATSSSEVTGEITPTSFNPTNSNPTNSNPTTFKPTSFNPTSFNPMIYAPVVSDPRGKNNSQSCKAVVSSSSGGIGKPTDPRLQAKSQDPGGSITLGGIADAGKRTFASRYVEEDQGSERIEGGKKRRMEDGSNVPARSSISKSQLYGNSGIRPKRIHRTHFEGRGELGESVESDRASSALGPNHRNAEGAHRRLGSTSNKRTREEENAERKRTKEEDLDTVTTNRPPVIPDCQPTTSDYGPTVSDHKFERVRRKSQTSEEFDFDEYESDLGAIQGSDAAETPSRDAYLNDDILDCAARSAGMLLAQNDPYLNQLACHEQRVKLARSTRETSLTNAATPCPAKGKITEKEMPKELLRTFSYPPDRTASSSHGRPPLPRRTSLPPPQTDGESRGNNVLSDVIERVKANNPRKAPTPVVVPGDGLSYFRRYHGGPRARVARPVRPTSSRHHNGGQSSHKQC